MKKVTILLLFAILNISVYAGDLDFAQSVIDESLDRYIREKVTNMKSQSQCENSGIVYLYRPSTDLGLCQHKDGKCAAIYYNSIVYDFNGRKTLLTLANLPELEVFRCALPEEMALINKTEDSPQKAAETTEQIPSELLSQLATQNGCTKILDISLYGYTDMGKKWYQISNFLAHKILHTTCYPYLYSHTNLYLEFLCSHFG